MIDTIRAMYAISGAKFGRPILPYTKLCAKRISDVGDESATISPRQSAEGAVRAQCFKSKPSQPGLLC